MPATIADGMQTNYRLIGVWVVDIRAGLVANQTRARHTSPMRILGRPPSRAGGTQIRAAGLVEARPRLREGESGRATRSGPYELNGGSGLESTEFSTVQPSYSSWSSRGDPQSS